MLSGGPNVPTPAVIATRPRDARGYPVPAITPWVDGVPQFATTGVARTFLCAVERRCSICACRLPDGPAWRVVGGAEADAIAATASSGRPYRNQAPSAEAPGHRACMLYAAVICPYLARPNARRGVAANAPGITAARGSARGRGGAVVGFERYQFEYDGNAVRFRFDGLIEFRPHDLGAEHLAELAAAVATEPSYEPAPIYLGGDESAAEEAFAGYVRRLRGGSDCPPSP
jgi:hypothetical protein